MQLQRITWLDRTVLTPWRRAVAATSAAFSSMLRAPGGGLSWGRVASSPRAEEQLRAIETSPTVFAAMNRTSLAFTTFPIKVYRGFSVGGDKTLDPLPGTVPWVAAFLRLLQTPDVESADELCPEPGEALIAQVVADLRMAGVFYVLPTLTASGDVIGLKRLHPKSCTIERVSGREVVVYRPPDGGAHTYPRRSVFVGHLISWSASGQGSIGVGAGASLTHVVAAEAEALRKTAEVVRQGGADIRIVAENAAGAAFMADKKNRDKVVAEVTTAISGEDGRRVFATGGNIRVEDAGLKPSDIQAPELMDRAPKAEMVAIGTVPAALGMDASNYANGVLQWRAQADIDEGTASVLEAYLLRPLARRFARQAGGRAATWIDEITARHDLSMHIGYTYVRAETWGVVHQMMQAGYTNEQAVAMCGIDAPKPEGEVLLGAAKGTPGPEQGSVKDAPRRPVLDSGGPTGPRVAAEPRLLTVDDLLSAAK